MTWNMSRRTAFKALAGAALLPLSLSLATKGFAQSLQDLRANGSIGEAFDGFARVRQNAPGAQAVVDATNAKRRPIYASRAGEQGVSADQVGRVYAKTIFDKAAPGTWFLSASGQWSQK